MSVYQLLPGTEIALVPRSLFLLFRPLFHPLAVPFFPLTPPVSAQPSLPTRARISFTQVRFYGYLLSPLPCTARFPCPTSISANACGMNPAICLPCACRRASMARAPHTAVKHGSRYIHDRRPPRDGFPSKCLWSVCISVFRIEELIRPPLPGPGSRSALELDGNDVTTHLAEGMGADRTPTSPWTTRTASPPAERNEGSSIPSNANPSTAPRPPPGI